MSEPFLHIIIPTFNRAPYLAALLNTLRKQVGLDVAVTILDNQSTDATPQVVAQANLPFPLKYFRHNPGIPGPMNVHYAYCRGGYRWVIGDDELLAPDSVSLTLKYLDAHAPGLLLHRAPGFELCPIPEYFKNYIEFAHWCRDNNPHTLLAHSLISCMTTQVYDASFAILKMDTDYAQMYGIVKGMLNTGLPLVRVKEYSLVVRHNRAPFTEPAHDLERKQTEYLSWINDELSLGLDPTHVVSDYRAKVKPESQADYDYVTRVERSAQHG